MDRLKRWGPWVLIFLVILWMGKKINFLDDIKNIIGSGVSHIDTNGPAQVIVGEHSVTVKPAPSKTDPKPTPVTTWKPIESKPTITTDEHGAIHVKIPRFGLCFVPKVGVEFHPHSKINWAIGARLFFWNRLGVSGMFNDKGISPQADFRVGNLGIGLGPWFGWTGGGGISGTAAFYVL